MTTCHGSCFCGAVTYEADGDLADGTGRCNCSFCRKVRNWTLKLPKGEKGLRILKGEADLAHVPNRNGADLHHSFCRHCGTRMFTRGNNVWQGGEVVLIHIPTIEDATDLQLAEAPVRYMDGAHDDWGHEPEETRHL